MALRWNAMRAGVHIVQGPQVVTIGDKIRLAREARGLSQEALAMKAEMCRETVSTIECGSCDPRFSTVERLIKALDLRSFEELEALCWHRPTSPVSVPALCRCG